MALPKTEIPRGRFTLKAILKEIEGELKALFAPLNLKPPKEEVPDYSAPGPVEWEGEEAAEKPVGRTELVEIGAKKGFPEKKPMMDSKKMHKPRVKRPEIKRGKVRGKLQKNL